MLISGGRGAFGDKVVDKPPIMRIANARKIFFSAIYCPAFIDEVSAEIYLTPIYYVSERVQFD